MIVIHEVTNKGQDYRYFAFFCPGCKRGHVFNSTWNFNLDFEKPTITPSILVTGHEIRCHSYITDGKIRFLDDCHHELKNQTVDLQEF